MSVSFAGVIVMPFLIFALFWSIGGKKVACNVAGVSWPSNNLVTLDDWNALALTFGSMKMSNLTLDACDVQTLSFSGTNRSDCATSPLLV